MNLHRRQFLSTLPIIPPGIKQVLRAPKDEQSQDRPMRKVPKASIKLAASAPGVRITSIIVDSGQVTLVWSGGNPCWVVQQQTELGGPWTQVGNKTLKNTATFPAVDHAFFRIMDGASCLLTANSLPGGGARVAWDEVPDL